MMRLQSLILRTLTAMAAAGWLAVAAAEPLQQTQTAVGGVGLIEMPSARMAPDGEFGVHLSQIAPYSRYVVYGQPLPWLEVLFKYTDIANREYGAGSSQGYKDKSVDVKARLWEESYYWPEVSVGIRDVGGTGLFSSEYLVASKQWGRWDVSLGLGWGYLASRGDFPNPLAQLSDSYKTRETDTGQGGTIDPTTFFAGERMSLFAGVSYHMADWPVVLKLEYDANDYQHEPKGNVFKQDLPFNVGAVYALNKGVDLHAGYARGNELMLGITFHTNVAQDGMAKLLDAQPEAVQLDYSPEKQPVDWPQVAHKLCDEAGFCAESIQLRGDTLQVDGKQNTYIAKAKGLGRASRILTNRVGSEVERFSFVETERNLTFNQVTIDRKTFHKVATLETEPDTLADKVSYAMTTPVEETEAVVYQAKPSRLSYSLEPKFSGSFGGPDGFLLYQLRAAGAATYKFTGSNWLSGSIGIGLIDNYDLFEYEAPSNLPRVRTEVRDYLKTSRVRIDNLQFNSVGQPGRDWFVMGYAGYLESMFGGIGGEVLYRPYGRSWALGLDVNHVKKRDYDQRFDFLDYEVNTGHLTAYYRTQNQVEVKLSAGQYLAKDKGVTLDLSRTFKSGATMGVWATKTDVSAEEFGEGSFDKGFYFSFPLDIFWFKSTTNNFGFRWQFLTRDGGQKLGRQYSLYDLTEDRNIEWIKQSF
ncbi:MAG: YjbH domain-containing protein, partial [Sphingobacteriales bacterium]|nr:YjbH domain-containing protein [Sphingobacteriales bacterium]